jgi:hypothetical protein
MVRAGNYNISYERGNENHQLGTVKRVEFVSNRVLYI